MGVEDKTLASKEPNGKVWIYLPLVIPYKSLNKHDFQNERIWALPKAHP